MEQVYRFTKELKEGLIAAINSDTAFKRQLYVALIGTGKNEVVTKSYLDAALAAQSVDFGIKLAAQSVDFDAKLAKQSADFDAKLAKQSVDFDAKLAKQSAQLTANFDAKLAAQSADFDKKLEKQSKDLKKFFKDILDAKLGALGHRWGMGAESTIRNFAKTVISSFGGKVQKWHRKIKFTDEFGYKLEKGYELDIVITDSKQILIEVKSSCDGDDLMKFIEAAEYYVKSEGKGKKSEMMMVTFYMEENMRAFAKESGINVVSP